MGIGLFAEAGIVPVAYAQVEADGSSTESNSGITVARIQAGAYTLTLPADKSVPDKEAYPQITVWGAPGVIPSITPTGPADQRIYTANFVDRNTGNLVDAKFSFTLFRTISPISNGVPA